jgi:hypothetical protein
MHQLFCPLALKCSNVNRVGSPVDLIVVLVYRTLHLLQVDLYRAQSVLFAVQACHVPLDLESCTHCLQMTT